MNYYFNTVSKFSCDGSEEGYFNFFSHHAGNSLQTGDRNRFNLMMDYLFGELSQDREIDPKKKLKLVRAIRSFVKSKEVMIWLNSRYSNVSFYPTRLRRLYHREIQPALSRIVSSRIG